MKETFEKSAETEIPATEAAGEDLACDEELIAVVAAAVATVQMMSGDRYIVRSIKRRKWNKW